MMKKISATFKLLCLSLLLLSGSAAFSSDLNMLTAMGFGTVDAAKFKGPRGKMLAKRAAKVDGQRNLLETINGVRITSGTTVKDMTLESDVIGNRVKGMLRGAFMVSENVYEDSGIWVAEVEMAVCLSGGVKACDNKPTLTSLMQPELKETAAESIFKPATSLAAAATKPAVAATGLILDVSQQDFAPLLDVRVNTNDGKELYGPGQVSAGADWLHWATSVESAKSMADVVGENPLLVNAQDLGDDSQVIIADDDAVNIFENNLDGRFLADGKVILVVSP